MPGKFHHLDPHDGVVVKKLARVLPIGPDSAYHGGQVDHQSWPGAFIQPADVGLVTQVVFAAAGDKDVVVAFGPQLGDNGRSEEPASAGHHH